MRGSNTITNFGGNMLAYTSGHFNIINYQVFSMTLCIVHRHRHCILMTISANFHPLSLGRWHTVHSLSTDTMSSWSAAWSKYLWAQSSRWLLGLMEQCPALLLKFSFWSLKRFLKWCWRKMSGEWTQLEEWEKAVNCAVQFSSYPTQTWH